MEPGPEVHRWCWCTSVFVTKVLVWDLIFYTVATCLQNKNLNRGYPQQQGGLTIPFYANACRNRFPEPGSFQGPAPARPEHTEIYSVQRPHHILLLGKKPLMFRFEKQLENKTCDDPVDASEIQHHLGWCKNLVNSGINSDKLPQLVNAGFLVAINSLLACHVCTF